MDYIFDPLSREIKATYRVLNALECLSSVPHIAVDATYQLRLSAARNEVDEAIQDYNTEVVKHNSFCQMNTRLFPLTGIRKPINLQSCHDWFYLGEELC